MTLITNNNYMQTIIPSWILLYSTVQWTSWWGARQRRTSCLLNVIFTIRFRYAWIYPSFTEQSMYVYIRNFIISPTRMHKKLCAYHKYIIRLIQRHIKDKGQIVKWKSLLAKRMGITVMLVGGFKPVPSTLASD